MVVSGKSWAVLVALPIVAAGCDMGGGGGQGGQAPPAGLTRQAMEFCEEDSPLGRFGSWNTVVPGTARLHDSGAGGLREGMVVRIKVEGGTVNNGSVLNAEHGPAGAQGDPAPDDLRWPLPGANKYALIATWNPSGAWFSVGNDSGCVPLRGAPSASVPPTLFFTINDEDRENNRGEFTGVRIVAWDGRT